MTIKDLNLDLLDDESANLAIETVGGLAKQNNIDWALAGGLAVILYGSDRMTRDVDIIASRLLPPKLKVAGRLRQGGERYVIETNKRETNVDWIIRNDDFKSMFQDDQPFRSKNRNVLNLNGLSQCLLKHRLKVVIADYPIDIRYSFISLDHISFAALTQTPGDLKFRRQEP